MLKLTLETVHDKSLNQKLSLRKYQSVWCSFEQISCPMDAHISRQMRSPYLWTELTRFLWIRSLLVGYRYLIVSRWANGVAVDHVTPRVFSAVSAADYGVMYSNRRSMLVFVGIAGQKYGSGLNWSPFESIVWVPFSRITVVFAGKKEISGLYGSVCDCDVICIRGYVNVWLWMGNVVHLIVEKCREGIRLILAGKMTYVMLRCVTSCPCTCCTCTWLPVR